MKARSWFQGWRPLVGALSIGVLAFTFNIEGAPRSMRGRLDRSPGGSGSASEAVTYPAADQSTLRVQVIRGDGAALLAKPPMQRLVAGSIERAALLGRVEGPLPIEPPMEVNYLDDDMTRARNEGKSFDYRTVAARGPGCSFDIECDDCDPCTDDLCDIAPGAPLGSGMCQNIPVPNGAVGGCSDGLCCNGLETCQNGVCEAPGQGTGTFDPQACQYPCSGGELCDEFDNKCKPPCDGTGFCTVSNTPCTTTLDCDLSNPDNFCKNCNDGSVCNGTETCSTGAPGDPPAGVCKPGDNPCGAAGATCGEKRCSFLANNPPFCSTDADCPNGGSCSIAGPICLPGRCCTGTTEPSCTRRAKSVTFQGAASCDSVAGLWYPGDGGDIFEGGTGSTCPSGEGPVQTVKCPKYSSGIAPPVDFDTEVALTVGPFSNAVNCTPPEHFDIGDDYTFSNESLPSNDFMAIDHLRWIGAATGGGRIVIEFRDALGNLIEDAVTGFVGANLAIRSITFNPPITVPPSGYVTMRPAPQFSPNGRVFWVATQGVDVGVNDTDRLWYDSDPNVPGSGIHDGTTFISECVGGANDGGWCDPSQAAADCPAGTCTVRDQVLAFELEGVKVPEPLGACCDLDTGTCEGKVEWLCRGEGGSPVGTGSFCNTCSGAGQTVGQNCSFCSGGSNDGNACQRPADCPGGTCAAHATVCGNRCLGGANSNKPCLGDDDCPGSTCSIGSVPGMTCVSNATCASGACCHPDGTCTTGSNTDCTNAGGDFQGFGTDCDADHGFDFAGQHCCPQPVDTGGDNCENATLIPITVPAPGTDPITITVSSDNSPASGQDSCSDDIFDISTGPAADPGWWHKFTLDSCAYVRIDFCCSDPTVEPQWSFMYRDCPCNPASIVTPAANPNHLGEASLARGGPYCADDDNLWLWFGPLPAGLYVLPVYSVLAGHHGPYQMHITVEPCPLYACCDGATCSELNILDCQAIDGATFLGPPLRTPGVSQCDNETIITPETTCGTGSCCTAPGVCKDQIPDNGPPANPTNCAGVGGDYHGGIRCKGGTCSNDLNKSCSTDADCPTGGTCNGDELALNQPSPCPVCEHLSSSNCQLTTNSNPPNAYLSDDCVADCVADPTNGGLFVADDFVAETTGSITTVCMWGMYLDQGPGGLPDCGPTMTQEDFRVVVYGDRGLPDETNIIGATSTTIIAKGQVGTFAGRQHYQWQLQLNSPIPVQQGQTYWISIVANTRPEDGNDECDWFWSWAQTSPVQGNNYRMLGQDETWTASDVLTDGDQSFCLNIARSIPAVPVRACCACSTFPNPGGEDPHCANLNAEDCILTGGDWLFNEQDCTGVICQVAGFTGDGCGTAPTITDGTQDWNNFCAGTDGPATLTCEGASTRFGADIWFKYTTTCNGTLTVETCDPSGEIDTVLALYHNPATPGVCPCPPANDNSTQFGDCNDDGCVFVGSGSQLVVPNVTTGQCITIRVAGFQGVEGRGKLHVTCESGGGGPADVIANGDAKVRYLSFDVPPPATAAGETAIQVQFIQLMVPDPPNPPNFPAPNFSAFNGQVRWVGPVGDCQETESPQTFFKCAAIQCTPHYTNWSADLGGQTLHVYGDGLVPSSTYNVKQFAVSCMGNEGACTATSPGVVFKTQRWGDVVGPYQLPAPAPLNQPNIADVAAIVDKFKQTAGAIIVARADIQPDTPNRIANIADVAAGVDAFKNFAYPFDGPTPCP